MGSQETFSFDLKTTPDLIVAYDLSKLSPREKSRFTKEFYGRRHDGVIHRVPFRRIARGVLEIPRDSFYVLQPVFRKYGIEPELIPIEEATREKISEIIGRRRKQFERWLQRSDAEQFHRFLVPEAEELEVIEDEGFYKGAIGVLAGTIDRWIGYHGDDEEASIFLFAKEGLERARQQDFDQAKLNVRRALSTLREWMVGYRVLTDREEGSRTLGELVERYRAETS